MRIGIDARLRAYRGGGIPEHVDRLLEGLASLPESSGQRAHAFWALDHRRYRGTAYGLASRRLVTPPHHRLEGWTLPLELAPLRLDLLHCPDMVVPRLWRGRSVVTIHDLTFLEQPALVTADAARYYGGVLRSVVVADRIITVSEHAARQLALHTSADAAKVRIVPNAVHPRFFRPAEAAADAATLHRLRLARDGYVLHVGTIEPRKNLGVLLEAFAALPSELDLQLALVGEEGWLTGPVRSAAAAAGRGGRVRFLGRVPQDDLPALYRGALLLAHPALDEGFGLTIAEAMACGTPVLATNRGAVPSVAGGAAELLDPQEPAAWRDAMASLAADPARRADLAERGRRQAAGLTIERTARATVEVYDEALRR
jgi:glycosyltransferase involved in cell wall biosynthesis